MKKETPTQVLFCEVGKNFKNIFFKEQLRFQLQQAVYGFILEMKQQTLILILQTMFLNLSNIKLNYWKTLKLLDQIES